MDTNGTQWIPMDPDGSRWILMDPNGSQWILINPDGPLRDPAGLIGIHRDPTRHT